MDDLFKTRANSISLPLLEERALIEAAQQNNAFAGDAVWALLFQYRGLLQQIAYNVQKSVRGMPAEQVEDLQADLVLAAVEAIKSFDLLKFTRLSQVLPGHLKSRASEMTTALSIPKGMLARWFKIWRAAEQDFTEGARLAPTMGMSANTFRAIQHGLVAADSEWASVPYSGALPTADEETYRLAYQAMAVLSQGERSVIELTYGFAGEPKTDEEVALILDSTKGTVKSQRQRAILKMRKALTEDG